MTDKAPLGELILTDYEAARPILEAWARGEPLQWEYGNGCTSDGSPRSICTDVTYRIPPHPHTVDWSQVGERVVAFETTEFGVHVAVTKISNSWPADLFPSFRPGTAPWQDSRIERPKGDGK